MWLASCELHGCIECFDAYKYQTTSSTCRGTPQTLCPKPFPGTGILCPSSKGVNIQTGLAQVVPHRTGAERDVKERLPNVCGEHAAQRCF